MTATARHKRRAVSTRTGKGVWEYNWRGRRPPASCIPTAAATGRSWCCCTRTLSLPALATVIAEFLTERDLRHVTLICTPPLPFCALSKRRIPDDFFRSWIHPLRHNTKVRRDLTQYLRNVLKPQLLLAWADQQRTFTGPVLSVWARHDELMPPHTPNDSPNTSRTHNSRGSTTARPSSPTTGQATRRTASTPSSPRVQQQWIRDRTTSRCQ